MLETSQHVMVGGVLKIGAGNIEHPPYLLVLSTT